MRKNIHLNENSKYKIIAVDDESGVLDSLNVFLSKAGYNFVGVTDPLEAIELVREEHFDLMLLDFIIGLQTFFRNIVPGDFEVF